MHRSASSRQLLSLVFGAALLVGCGQEIFVADGGVDAGFDGGGDGGDPDAGPPLAGLSATRGFAGEGITGATWSEEVRVQLAHTDPAPVAVTVTSSDPAALSVADGGLLLVPAGELEAPVVVTGHAAAAEVVLTFTRGPEVLDAEVRVIGASEVPELTELQPDGGTFELGASIPFTFELEFPSPRSVDVTVEVTPSAAGNAPALVTVPAFATDGGFTFEADGAAPAATITVSTSNELSAALAFEAPLFSELAYESGASASDEFVELYNPGETPFDLTGVTVQYESGSSGGVSWLTFHDFPSSGGPSIPARGFFLIGGSAFSGPTVDATRSNGGVSLGGDGSLRLIRGATVFDQVAWGGGDAPEGAGAPAPIDDQSLERKANASSDDTTLGPGGADELLGNGHDTNDNAQDFVVRTLRDPQNTASTPEP